MPSFLQVRPKAVIRPISGLPDDDDLKAAAWEFVQAIAPECGPTQSLVSRICRAIKNVLVGVADDNDEDESPTGRSGFHVGPRKARSIAQVPREAPFVRPLLRLSSWQGFSLELVLSHGAKLDAAQSLYQACPVMLDRCELVRERLAANFPELAVAKRSGTPNCPLMSFIGPIGPSYAAPPTIRTCSTSAILSSFLRTRS